MRLRPEPLPPIPDTTAAAVRAAFPKGNLSVALRTEFGTLYHDQLFADLYPPEGRPVEVAPWRLALVMVMQYIEGLTDRQAADAVRRCMDWKYALSLDLHDPRLRLHPPGPAGAFKQKSTVSLWKKAFAAPSTLFERVFWSFYSTVRSDM